MSRKYQPHYADVKGALTDIPGVGITQAYGTTLPTDGAAGYAKGCLFHKTNGAAGANLYLNEGSVTSADFNAVQTPTNFASLDLTALTATAAELNTLHTQTMSVPPGAGFTGGTGTVCKTSVQLSGGIYTTRILFDLTGLASSTTDLDIIGVGSSVAHLGQITVAQNGTLLGGTLQCLEVPTGGISDIDLYTATEGTGVFDGLVTDLTETALITAGGAWTLALVKAIADPVGIANKYLYLTGGAAGTAATYTAGKFLLTLYGT